jgi:serine/threonine protein phosphatase PrpC
MQAMQEMQSGTAQELSSPSLASLDALLEETAPVSVTAAFAPVTRPLKPPEQATMPIGTQERPALSVLTVQLSERLLQEPRRRVWLGLDADGERYRVEERVAQEREQPSAFEQQLRDVVLMPVGSTRHGDHELLVFREQRGETLRARRSTETDEVEPLLLLRWLRPVALAMARVNAFGYALTGLSSEMVLFLDESGEVAFDGVGFLTPLHEPASVACMMAGYSAPELYAGDYYRRVSARSDVYGFAMLAYEVVTGRIPPSCAESGYHPMIWPRDTEPGFPLGLGRFFAACAAYDPAERPRSLEAALELLEECVQAVSMEEPARGFSRLTASCETHPGITKRLRQPVNQDAVFCAVDAVRSAVLLCVSDGVSTASFGSGEIASAMVVRRAREVWSRYQADEGGWDWPRIAMELKRAVQTANADVVGYVDERFAPFRGEPQEVMAATCVLAFVLRSDALVISIGDSRSYLFRQGFLERIGRDHNLMTLSVADGMPAHLAATLPQGGTLARCVGTFDLDEEGHLVPAQLVLDSYLVHLRLDDRLLLCTDGVTDYLGDSDRAAEAALTQLLLREPTPELVCLDILTAANRGGGGDNIGVAVCVAGSDYITAAERSASGNHSAYEQGGGGH